MNRTGRIGWGYIALATAIAAFAAGAYVYNARLYMPADVRAALAAFERDGDPMPLALLGARAAPAVPAFLEAAKNRPRNPNRPDSENVAVTLGIIGSPKAERFLIARLDEIEANPKAGTRFRAYATMPMVTGLALIERPSARRRLFYFLPLYPITREDNFAYFSHWFDAMPEEPPDIAAAIQDAPNDNSLWAIVYNLKYSYYGFAGSGDQLPSRIGSSEEIVAELIARSDRYPEGGGFFKWREHYLSVLSRFTVDEARRFVKNSGYIPKREQDPEQWRKDLEKHAKQYAVIPDMARIHQSIEKGRPDILEWAETRDKEKRDAIAHQIIPVLIRTLDPELWRKAKSSGGEVGDYPNQILVAFFHLKRFSGENYGLDADAWQAWYDRERAAGRIAAP